jgi:hypothetical protein
MDIDIKSLRGAKIGNYRYINVLTGLSIKCSDENNISHKEHKEQHKKHGERINRQSVRQNRYFKQ